MFFFHKTLFSRWRHAHINIFDRKMARASAWCFFGLVYVVYVDIMVDFALGRNGMSVLNGIAHHAFSGMNSEQPL
jgi:hypothetical protein